MGNMSSSDQKTENTTDSQSEKLGVPSPSEEMGDSNSSEKLGDSSTVRRDPVESESDQSKEEEEGECGFCLFMKGGGCKESFTAWEVCVEQAEENKEDIVTKCMEVTATLKKCMDVHSDYYQPILAAERAAEEEVKKDLEAEKKKKKEGEAS